MLWGWVLGLIASWFKTLGPNGLCLICHINWVDWVTGWQSWLGLWIDQVPGWQSHWLIWHLLTCTLTYWHTMTCTNKCWQILTHTDTYWHVLTHTDAYWCVLTRTDAYWHILTRTDAYWQDTYWHLLTPTGNLASLNDQISKMTPRLQKSETNKPSCYEGLKTSPIFVKKKQLISLKTFLIF